MWENQSSQCLYIGLFPNGKCFKLSSSYQTTMANVCHYCSIMLVNQFLPPIRVHIRHLTEYALSGPYRF